MYPGEGAAVDGDTSFRSASSGPLAGGLRAACGGFTLVELILVMGLLAAVMGLAAPSLAKFFRQRAVDSEAARFVSLTEFARHQAIARGIPMVVWIDPEETEYGMEPEAGYPSAAGDVHSFSAPSDLAVQVDEPQRSPDGTLDVVVFLPDGSMDLDYLDVLYLEDRFGNQRVVQCTNGYGYVVLREEENATTHSRS